MGCSKIWVRMWEVGGLVYEDLVLLLVYEELFLVVVYEEYVITIGFVKSSFYICFLDGDVLIIIDGDILIIVADLP